MVMRWRSASACRVSWSRTTQPIVPASIVSVIARTTTADQITAMLSVDFDDEITARDVENLVWGIEEEAAERFPTVKRLFIRPRSPVDLD